MQQTCKYIYALFVLIFTVTIVGISLGHEHHPYYNQDFDFLVDASQAYDCLACHFVVFEPAIDDQNKTAKLRGFESVVSCYDLFFYKEPLLFIDLRGPPLLA